MDTGTMKTNALTKTHAGRSPDYGNALYFIMPESLNDPCCTSRKPTFRHGADSQLFTGEMNAN
jgi:hypothetical protein